MTPPPTPPTLLVLRALGLGDLLTAVPALRALRAHYPDHHIVLAAPAALRGLVGLIDAVDELLPTSDLDSLVWAGPPPEIAVNLHGAGPESIWALQTLRPARLISHGHPACPKITGPAWVPDAHDVHRWCRLLAEFGIWADPTDLELPVPPTPSPAPGAVVMHPGAAFGARRWPPARYSAVARALSALGQRVVITGDPNERHLGRMVGQMANLPRDAVLSGRTDLRQLAALVANARLVVCGDTGVAHLATAYCTPSVSLFGPVSPQQWGPPQDRPWHTVLWAGETGDTFADEPAAGLLKITPADVTRAAGALLARSALHAGSGVRGAHWLGFG
ncbi:MAG: transferase [Pseudonocardia sp.]|jgi:ADP-heptose:LPS heptosyltransferase|nr:transferase [Pseudonocardia sp.]